MAKRSNLQADSRFFPSKSGLHYSQQSRCDFREVFPEGHWNSIKANLELQGWTPTEILMIKDFLRNGWPLVNALTHVSARFRRCPVASKKKS